jgi:hypothetical protein
MQIIHRDIIFGLDRGLMFVDRVKGLLIYFLILWSFNILRSLSKVLLGILGY